MDAEDFGGCAVVGTVVDEEGLIGCGLLTFEHHAENLWRRLRRRDRTRCYDYWKALRRVMIRVISSSVRA